MSDRKYSVVTMDLGREKLLKPGVHQENFMG